MIWSDPFFVFACAVFFLNPATQLLKGGDAPGWSYHHSSESVRVYKPTEKNFHSSQAAKTCQKMDSKQHTGISKPSPPHHVNDERFYCLSPKCLDFSHRLVVPFAPCHERINSSPAKITMLWTPSESIGLDGSQMVGLDTSIRHSTTIMLNFCWAFPSLSSFHRVFVFKLVFNHPHVGIY